MGDTLIVWRHAPCARRQGWPDSFQLTKRNAGAAHACATVVAGPG